LTRSIFRKNYWRITGLFGTEVFKVTPSVWCIRRPSFFACSYIIERQNGDCLLVDTGMNSDGKDVMNAFEKLQKPLDSIKGVMLSHWHNDHVAGAAAVEQLTGASIYYHSAEEPYLAGKKAKSGLRGYISDLLPEWSFLVLLKGFLGEATPKPVNATKFVNDGDILFDDFEVIETPGHTAGHCSYYYKPEKVLFSGDALAIVNGKVRFLARPVNNDIKEARKSMLKLFNYEIQTICPGHRIPLTKNVQEECDRMKQYIIDEKPWPLLG